MIATRHWSVAVATALVVHCLALAGWPFAATDGARDHGEQGVEIGFGLLGDLGDAAEEAAPALPSTPQEREPPVAPEPEPEPPEREPVVAPEPELDLEPEPPVVQQEPLVPTELLQPQAREPSPRLAAVSRVGAVTDDIADSTSPSTPSAAGSRGQQSTGRRNDPNAGGRPGVRLAYAALLAARLNRFKNYPISSRRQRQEGVVTLRLVVQRDGRVVQADISGNSTFPALDAAAMEMLERAKPLPPFPDGMPQSQVAVNVPVSFKLRADD